jgi:hypothetical protein
LKIGKNLDIYGFKGGAAGSRPENNHNDFKKRLGDTANTFASTHEGQSRLKDYHIRSGIFNPGFYRNSSIPILW